VAGLLEPGRSLAERWASASTAGMVLAWIAAAGIGVLALWIVVLAEPRAAHSQARLRWWLAAGLLIGLLAAARWLATIAGSGHTYSLLTWAVWLGLLFGPLVLGTYYLVLLVRQ